MSKNVVSFLKAIKKLENIKPQSDVDLFFAIDDHNPEFGTTSIPAEYKNEEEMEKEKMEQKSKTKEYLINGDNYFPNLKSERSSTLPAGTYEIATTMEGAPYLKPIKIITDNIVDLDDGVTKDVVDELKLFWSSGVTEKFKQYGLIQKRGILLHGIPGTGKTLTLAKAAQYAIKELGAIVLFNPSFGMLKDFLQLIRQIEPDKKILIMCEELDSILEYESESTILSILDGEIQVDNIIFLATTNYISKIPARIKNRPSRFARVIEVGIPTVEMRTQFLKAKLHETDAHLLPSLVQASDGFVIDQCKDLIISVCCFNYKIEDAVMKIAEMRGAIGVDDYNEEQRNEVFKFGKKDRKASPLQPIK